MWSSQPARAPTIRIHSRTWANASSSARQFHDPTGWTGRQIAASLGFPTQLAWDTFLFYRAGLGWNEAPPAPTDWAHQLDYSKWAGPAHLCTGPALLRYLKAGIRTYAVRSNF